MTAHDFASLPGRLRPAALAGLIGLLLHQTNAVEADDIDEIVVTARKIAEPLQNVPLSIDVVRDDGAESGMDSLQTLIARVPGLYFESTWGGLGSTPTLRGQQPSIAGDVNVGVFIDGVYQANPTALDSAPIDIERVEVVRGPQSALFGHNTFAGAIHYVGAAPTAELESGFSADVGSDDYRSAAGHVSGPIGQGGVLGRAAVGWRSFGGGYENTTAPGEYVGGWERRSLALSLARPGDGLAATVSARLNETRSTQPAAAALTYMDYNCGAVEAASGAWSYFCGELPIMGAFGSSPGIPDSDAGTAQLSLQLSWPTAHGSFESHTTLYRSTSDAYRDFDASGSGQFFGVCTLGMNCTGPAGVPRPINRLVQLEQVLRQKATLEEWSQEMRWHSSGGDRLRWGAGAVVWQNDERSEALAGFERGDVAASERLTALLPLTPLYVGPVWIGNAALVDDPNGTQVTRALDFGERKSIAVFGTLDYRFGAALEARLEIRATQERRSLDNQLADFLPGFGGSISPQEFQDVTPRLSVQWNASEPVDLYFSAAKGSQSGGINPVPGLLPEEQSYEPEYNWTYELGVRHRGTNFGIDSTAYYIDWRNAQLIGFPGTPNVQTLITLNTAGLRTRGVEVTLFAEPLTTLKTELGVSYTDAEYRGGSDDPGSRRFCGLSGANVTSTLCTIGPARESGIGLVPYIDGNMPPRAPQRTLHVGIEYSPPLRAAGRLTVRFDASGQDDVFERAINGAEFGARMLFDARVAYDFGDWSIAFWGRNLGDAGYVRAVSSRGQVYFPTTPRPLDMLFGDPRRIGLTVAFNSGD